MPEGEAAGVLVLLLLPVAQPLTVMLPEEHSLRVELTVCDTVPDLVTEIHILPL